MQGPSAKNAPAAYGLLLVCVTQVWALCLAGAGVWPFGEGTLALIDNMQQQAPHFGSIPRLLDGAESLTWSYAGGGCVRSFLTPFSHNVIFPATWLAWLMPWNGILQALSWQLLFQLMAASVACCLYLRSRFKGTPWLLQVALAFSYAFSHFFLTKYLCVNFLNIYAVFPLFLLALDALLRRGRMAGYVVVMSLMMGFAGYFAWMFGLFALVYTLADRHPCRLWAWRGRVALLAGGTGLALALSCMMWLPAVLHMAGSSRAGEVSTDKLLQGMFYPDEVTLWTLLPLALACLLAASARRLKAVLLSREGLATAVICLGLLFSAASFVWCIGSPVCFMSRFSYMAGMLCCCMACRAWGGGAAGLRVRFKRFAVLMAGMGALAAVSCRFLRYEPAPQAAAMWGFAIGAVLLALLLVCIRRPKWLLVSCMAGTVAVFSAFFSCHAGYKYIFSELRMVRIQNDYRMRDLSGGLPMSPGDRVKSVDMALLESDASYAGINRFSNNIQSATKAQQETLARLGYLDWWTRLMDIGGTALSDSFLGFRYWVAERPSLDGLAPCVHAEPGLYVYANPFHWGLGALVASKDASAADDAAPSMQHQAALYCLLAGRGAPSLFRPVDAPVRGLWFYRQCGDDPSAFDSGIFPEVKDLGGTPHDRMLIQYAGAAGPSGFAFDAEALSRLAEKHRGEIEVLGVVRDGVDLCIHPRHGKDMLLFPLLYHKGYRAVCQGNELDVVDTLGFIGVRLPDGVADGACVQLRFTLPGQGLGGAVSLCGAVVSLLLLWRRKEGGHGGGFARCTGGICLAAGYALLGAFALWTAFWIVAFICSRLGW